MTANASSGNPQADGAAVSSSPPSTETTNSVPPAARGGGQTGRGRGGSVNRGGRGGAAQRGGANQRENTNNEGTRSQSVIDILTIPASSMTKLNPGFEETTSLNGSHPNLRVRVEFIRLFPLGEERSPMRKEVAAICDDMRFKITTLANQFASGIRVSIDSGDMELFFAFTWELAILYWLNNFIYKASRMKDGDVYSAVAPLLVGITNKSRYNSEIRILGDNLLNQCCVFESFIDEINKVCGLFNDSTDSTNIRQVLVLPVINVSSLTGDDTDEVIVLRSSEDMTNLVNLIVQLSDRDFDTNPKVIIVKKVNNFVRSVINPRDNKMSYRGSADDGSKFAVVKEFNGRLRTMIMNRSRDIVIDTNIQVTNADNTISMEVIPRLVHSNTISEDSSAQIIVENGYIPNAHDLLIHSQYERVTSNVADEGKPHEEIAVVGFLADVPPEYLGSIPVEYFINKSNGISSTDKFSQILSYGRFNYLDPTYNKFISRVDTHKHTIWLINKDERRRLITRYVKLMFSYDILLDYIKV